MKPAQPAPGSSHHLRPAPQQGLHFTGGETGQFHHHHQKTGLFSTGLMMAHTNAFILSAWRKGGGRMKSREEKRF